jgi:hypothetical protein
MIWKIEVINEDNDMLEEFSSDFLPRINDCICLHTKDLDIGVVKNILLNYRLKEAIISCFIYRG